MQYENAVQDTPDHHSQRIYLFVFSDSALRSDQS